MYILCTGYPIKKRFCYSICKPPFGGGRGPEELYLSESRDNLSKSYSIKS